MFVYADEVIGHSSLCLGGRRVPQETDDDEMSPQLVEVDGGYRVIVEGERVLDVKDLTNAVLAWVAIHFVCNMIYGKHVLQFTLFSSFQFC